MARPLLRQAEQGAIFRESVDIFKRDKARKELEKHRNETWEQHQEHAPAKKKELPQDADFWPVMAKTGTVLTPELATVLQALHGHMMDVGAMAMDVPDYTDKFKEMADVHRHVDLKKHLQHQFAHQWYGNANDFIADYSKANGFLPRPKDMVDHAKSWLSKNKPGKTAAIPPIEMDPITQQIMYMALPEHDWGKHDLGDHEHWADEPALHVAGERTAMPTYYHATPWQNRDNILQHGLDYTQGEHQWGETPGNYFWQNKHDANEYAEDMGQMDRDNGGYSDDPEEYDWAVMPFKYTGPVMDDPEGNHEMARGKSFYTTDPIPASAFQTKKPKLAELQTNWNQSGLSDTSLQDTGQELGTHHAHVMSHVHTGEKWLVKPAPSSGPFLPDLDVGANQIAAASGVDTPATFMTKYKGKPASAQQMYPGAKDGFPGGFDPESVSDEDLMTVQKHHALDWLLGNHDSHHGQFVRNQEGKLIGIDKGQAGKYAGYDRLHWNFHPNAAYGEHEPLYNTLYRNFAQGGRRPFDPRQGELSSYIKGLQGMDDNDFKAALAPYAKKAADVGQLANLGGGSPGNFPGLLQNPAIPPNDPDAYLNSVLERKHGLMDQMGDLYDRALAHRMTGTKIAYKVAAPDPDQLVIANNQPGDLGSHGSAVYSDKTGRWLIKTPQVGNEFMVPLDIATTRLAYDLGLKVAETYAVPLDGRIATAVHWMRHAHQEWQRQPSLASVASRDLLTLQKHHVLDWVIANHDAHVGNFLRDHHGDLVGIDKSQALKYFGRDRLSWRFHPNFYAREPVYNALWRDYAYAKKGQLLDPREGELGEFTAALQNYPDDEYRALFAPYAHAAAKVGLLATGSVKNDPIDPRRRLREATVAVNDPEAFLDAVVARKNAVLKDMGEYYDRAAARRLASLANPIPDYDPEQFSAEYTAALGKNNGVEMYGAADMQQMLEYNMINYPDSDMSDTMRTLHAKWFIPGGEDDD